MGQSQSASADPTKANRPINLFIPPYAVPLVLPYSKRHSIKEETTASLSELQGDEPTKPEHPSGGAYLAKPSDWILVDIESLTIIRSVYAAEMVVGGGSYLVLSAKGLAMKESNPSQIARAMMVTWKDIKEEIVKSILPLSASLYRDNGSEPGSEDDPEVRPSGFASPAVSVIESKQDTELATPESSDQGSERDPMD